MVSQLAPVHRTIPSSEGTDRLSEAIRFGELLPGARLAVTKEQCRYQYRSEELFAAYLAVGVIE